jgi:hypothetical protein
LSREAREVIADWLILLGAVALLVSLCLPWSHQFSRAFLAEWAGSVQLRNVPHSPTAWQVYSAADVLLALLAGSLLAVALTGGRRRKLAVLIASACALAFTLHARSVPPTNGADISQPAVGVPGYVANSPAAAAGETVALAALGVAIVGVALSFTAD